MSEKKPRLIVGILGSPQVGGNVDLLLDAALQGAAESGAVTEKVILNELSIRPCQGCGGCSKTGRCVIRDDMDLVYDAITRMDGMILATPVYFGGVTAQTKAMIDRCQAFWSRKYLMKQPLSADGQNKHRDLLLLTTMGTDKPEHIEGVRTEVRYFLDTLDGQYAELIFPKIEQAGAIGDHWEAMAQAREAGARLLASR
jgi:multimeric flavodoxin WrbA